ncbi:MAG: lamin tail domain-containing protein [Bacteroidales bacterium]|nr:lamin tail domain-containing protein [Bacteroidales bacterium]
MKTSHFIFLPVLLFQLQHAVPILCNENITNGILKTSSEDLTKPCQVIISEIMADPYPCVLLPDAEYVELYNRSDQAVDLTGWYIVIGNRSKSFPYAIMDPGCRAILCDSERAEDLGQYGNTIPVNGLPSILNGGQTLILKNQHGTIIHSVSFSNKWYASSFKKEGGWSLEIIDPDNPCGKGENWYESDDYRGGTPGTENSVYAENPDILQPVLLRATYVTPNTVRLHFNESMDSASMMNRYNYSANHGLLHPEVVAPIPPDYASVILSFSADFSPDTKYRIITLDSLNDCAGNPLEKNAMVDFALPQEVDSFDIVVNEVLFDSNDHIDEFIELYNRSLKVIDLTALSVGLLDPFGLKINKLISLKDHAHLLFPDGYLVITPDKTNLPDITLTKWQQNIAEVQDLFSLPDEEGIIGLYDRQMHCIDRMTYSRHMHIDLLNSVEGASLERIRAEGNSQDIGNWHSASETSGFATPGYRNSQQLLHNPETGDLLIIPGIFSPDNDGCDDYVTICLNNNESGFIANIIIFDAYGREVNTLASNTLFGPGSCLTWDGRDNNNRIAGMGIYLLYVEMFDADKNLKIIKRAITLVKTLN